MRRIISGAAVLLSAALMSSNLHAQYGITWSTADGGGGTSTGGVHRLAGTIGQPDAGVMTGGPFTLQGGLWGGVAIVQTPGAPLLRALQPSGNTVMPSWPGPDAGWRLQATTNLSTTPVVWTPLPVSYQSNGTNIFVIDTAPGNQKFYRLQKP